MKFSGGVMGNDLATFDLFGYTAKNMGVYIINLWRWR